MDMCCADCLIASSHQIAVTIVDGRAVCEFHARARSAARPQLPAKKAGDELKK